MSDFKGLKVRKLAGDPDDGNARYYPDHVTGEPSLRPLGGVVFIDNSLTRTDEVPTFIRVPTDYVAREHWIELGESSVVTRPAGTAAAPYSKPPHVFVQTETLTLHMLNGDFVYRVVGQPDKYDLSTGAPTDEAGNPNTEVRWYYDAELIPEGEG